MAFLRFLFGQCLTMVFVLAKAETEIAVATERTPSELKIYRDWVVLLRSKLKQVSELGQNAEKNRKAD